MEQFDIDDTIWKWYGHDVRRWIAFTQWSLQRNRVSALVYIYIYIYIGSLYIYIYIYTYIYICQASVQHAQQRKETQLLARYDYHPLYAIMLRITVILWPEIMCLMHICRGRNYLKCLASKKRIVISRSLLLLIDHVITFRWINTIVVYFISNSDSKVHGANMGPTWVLSAPDGPHVGPMNLVIREHSVLNGLLQQQVLLPVCALVCYAIKHFGTSIILLLWG